MFVFFSLLIDLFVCIYETADIVCGEYKKKRGTLHVAVPLFEAFALPSLLKQQPKSTPYVLAHTYTTCVKYLNEHPYRYKGTCVYAYTPMNIRDCVALLGNQKLRSFEAQNKHSFERLLLCLVGFPTCPAWGLMGATLPSHPRRGLSRFYIS